MITPFRCRSGHIVTEDNGYIPRGRKVAQCRVCQREAAARLRSRNRNEPGSEKWTPETRRGRNAAWAVFRFYRNVAVSGDCCLWIGAKNHGGYGNFRFEGKTRLAHRWLWQRFHGELTREQILDHLCRNPACVNVAHLEVVDDRTNILRGIGPSAINAKKVLGSCGHVLEASSANRRICHQCRNAIRDAKVSLRRQEAASFNPVTRRSKLHARLKLTETDVKAIWLQIQNKVPYGEIVKVYPVTKSAISSIATGKTWSAVTRLL